MTARLVVRPVHADVDTVEKLHGVGRDQAATIIAQEAQLVRDQGVRVHLAVR